HESRVVYGDLGDESVLAATKVINRRDLPYVDRPLVQERRADRWHVEPERKTVGAPLQAEHQRSRVQIIDGADPDHVHRASPSRIASNRPFRSSGSSAAARTLRRTSSSALRRGPRSAASNGATESMSSAPKVSATCASLGP